MAFPEIEEEGEGPVEASLPSSAPSNGNRSQGDTINPYSKRGRLRYAWRIIRGKNVEDILTADPAEQIRNNRAQQDNRWRGVYAVALLLGMLAQIAFADWVFWRYLVRNGYDIPESVFIAFLTSVVVEVIGLVLVVTKSLFPSDPSGVPAK